MTKKEVKNKKKYNPPTMRIYSSLKDITAAQTCFCTDVSCPVYCQQYAYPMGGYGGMGIYCPRYNV